MESIKGTLKVGTSELQTKIKSGITVHQEIMNTYGNAIISIKEEEGFTFFDYLIGEVAKPAPEKLHIDWPTYLKLIDKLIEKIPKNKYTCVMGVPRGGLIPATIIAHRLNIPLEDFHYYESLGVTQGIENLLIIDDLVDTGDTLKTYEADIAVIHKKPWTKKEPTYFVEEVDKWVVYPYEVDDEEAEGA